MIHPALSIFTDEEVQEAIVIVKDGEYYCYPCTLDRIEKAQLVSKYVFDFIENNIFIELRDSIIFYLRKVNIIEIPVRRNRILALVVHRIVSGERIVKDVLNFIRKISQLHEDMSGIFSSFPHSDKENDDSIEYDGGDIESVYIYLAETLVRSNVAEHVMILRLDGVSYGYPRILHIFEVLKEELVLIHENLYEQLHYRAIRIIIGNKHVVVIPIDKMHLTVMSVDPNLSTLELLHILATRF